MNPKLLAFGLVGLGITLGASGAVYFVTRPAVVPNPVAVSVPAEAPAPAEPPTVTPAPAAPQSETTVPVEPASKPAPKPKAPAAAPIQPAQPDAVATKPVVVADTAAPIPVQTEPPVVVERPAAQEPAAAVEQKPRFEEVQVAADSVIGVRLDSTISSETAKVEDRVNARVSRDVMVDGKIAVPSGARLEGVVTEVVRGGKFKERPRVGVTFQQLILADGTKIALTTDTVFREGEAPNGVNAKVGGSAVVGAILGAMIGGKKGAVLGGAAGAAGGAAAVAAGDRSEVVLASGSSVTVRLKAPMTVLVERHP